MKSRTKGIEKLWKPLTLTLPLLALAFINVSIGPGPGPTYTVVPTNSIEEIGETFSIQVWGYNLLDIYAWQVHVKWPQSVLDVTNVVVSSNLLDRPRNTPLRFLVHDAPAGQKVVNVTGGEHFFAGLNVLIEDDSNSEMNQIALIQGNMLTMGTNLANTYTVSNNGQVRPWPLRTPSTRMINEQNPSFSMAGETTNGDTYGADADTVLLCTFTFLVEVETQTTLNISGIVPMFQLTYYQRSIDYPVKHFPTLEHGYYLGAPWIEDINGDGIVDIMDLSSVAIRFGETGSPGWIPEDIWGPSEVPDGVIDVWDLTKVCLKYGQYAG